MQRGAASDFTGAEAAFREAVRLAPDEPYPRYELGYTLALVGRYDDALAEFRRTYELAGVFFLVETEIWLCEQVLDGSLDDAVVGMLRELQQIADTGEESDEAVALSQRAIDAAPECALAYLHHGKAMLGRDPAAAEWALRRCIELQPDDTTAINAKGHLAILCSQAGNEGEARSIRESVLADYPDHPQTAFVRLA
jgi:Flp pilus assembly protein TadD